MARKLFLCACLFMCACLTQAGSVKVLKTTPVRYEMGEKGMALIVNVQLQISNVTSNDWRCIVFLYDEAWPVMSLRELAQFSEEEAYVGETMLEPVPQVLTKNAEVRVMLDLNYFKSESQLAYMQAYVVDIEGHSMLATGSQVHFPLREEKLTAPIADKLANAMKQHVAVEMVNGLIQGLFGGDDGSSGRGEGSVTCSHCHGGGRCYICYGDPDRSKNCDACHGSGKCSVCKGAGYY